MLKPFWCYYGGKYRAAPRYPKPRYDTIIEPFAGAAGYSMRYPSHKIILVDKYPVIAELWRYLIVVRPSEVMSIPLVEHIDDLPGWVPAGARYLIGFNLNNASASPRNQLSAGNRRCQASGWLTAGWTAAMRLRVAQQVEHIKHWQIIEGDYTMAPDVDACWFIDPPYDNKSGRLYPHHAIDYGNLGRWCLGRRGQVMVCENEGAMWMPFKPFVTLKETMGRLGSVEVLYTNDVAVESDQGSLFEDDPSNGVNTHE